jgi:hypothetical protein
VVCFLRRVALSGVQIEPATVTDELADAALACFAFERARALAEWVGAGKELTNSGLLRPAAAAQACEALGLERPAGKLRSASDVPDLMRDWSVASVAGFIVASSKTVYAADDLAELLADPGRVLDAWLRTVTTSMGLPDDPCATCLIVLHTLAAPDGPVGMADVINAAIAVAEADHETPCPDCGEIHEEEEAPDGIQHAMSELSELLAFGAAVLTDAVDGGVQLSPLGRMLADSVLGVYTPNPDEPAGTVIALLHEQPLPVALTLAQPWLDARSPVMAVRELLAYGASTSSAERITTLAIADSIGPAGAEAWREWVRMPGFGVYAREWLSGQGEEVTADPRDEAWLLVDKLSAECAEEPDELIPLVFSAAVEDNGEDPVQLLRQLQSSGHPDAPWLMQMFDTAMNWRQSLVRTPDWV